VRNITKEIGETKESKGVGKTSEKSGIAKLTATDPSIDGIQFQKIERWSRPLFYLNPK
jgi:hypothetical protein